VVNENDGKQTCAAGTVVLPAQKFGGKQFWGAKIFDFRRKTLFCFKNASQSTNLLYFLTILGGIAPLSPTGYAFVRGSCYFPKQRYDVAAFCCRESKASNRSKKQPYAV